MITTPTPQPQPQPPPPPGSTKSSPSPQTGPLYSRPLMQPSSTSPSPPPAASYNNSSTGQPITPVWHIDLPPQPTEDAFLRAFSSQKLSTPAVDPAFTPYPSPAALPESSSWCHPTTPSPAPRQQEPPTPSLVAESLKSEMSSASSTSLSVASPPASTQVASLQDALRRLRVFIGTAPSTFGPAESVKSFELPADFGTVSCVFWNDIYHITGTDIIKCMLFRVRAMNCVVAHMKKFEEGVFSDLRNLKPGVDSTLEEPKSPFLEFLVSQKCIRTQKKQKVFYWFSVDHDKLFLDAVDRDLKRMKQGQPSTIQSLASASPDEIFLAAQSQCAVPAQALPQDSYFQGETSSGHNNHEDAPSKQRRRTKSNVGSSTPPPGNSRGGVSSSWSSSSPLSSDRVDFSITAPVRRQRSSSSLSSLSSTSTVKGSPKEHPYLTDKEGCEPNVGSKKFRTCIYPECGRMFRHLEALRRHVRLHESRRPSVALDLSSSPTVSASSTAGMTTARSVPDLSAASAFFAGTSTASHEQSGSDQTGQTANPTDMQGSLLRAFSADHLPPPAISAFHFNALNAPTAPALPQGTPALTPPSHIFFSSLADPNIQALHPMFSPFAEPQGSPFFITSPFAHGDVARTFNPQLFQMEDHTSFPRIVCASEQSPHMPQHLVPEKGQQQQTQDHQMFLTPNQSLAQNNSNQMQQPIQQPDYFNLAVVGQSHPPSFAPLQHPATTDHGVFQYNSPSIPIGHTLLMGHAQPVSTQIFLEFPSSDILRAGPDSGAVPGGLHRRSVSEPRTSPTSSLMMMGFGEALNGTGGPSGANTPQLQHLHV